MKEQKQKLRKETITYQKIGKGTPLLFLHGFGIAPTYYEKFLKQLEGFEIIAPSMYAINEFKQQPTTIESYASFTEDFCAAIKFTPEQLLGHSTGGAIALDLEQHHQYENITVLNTITNTDYNTPGFIIRAIYKTIREETGIAEKERTTKTVKKIIFPFIKNTMKNIPASAKLIKDITQYDITTIQPHTQTNIITTNNDEYFPLTNIIKKHFQEQPHINHQHVKNANHDFPLLKPTQAAEIVQEYLLTNYIK